MPELVKQPTSRIVHIDGEHALSEDGSIWLRNDLQVPYMWVCVTPPTQSDLADVLKGHLSQLREQLVNQSAELTESLTVLRNLYRHAKANTAEGHAAFLAAYEFLGKQRA